MGQRIQDSYIVVMKAGASESLFQSLTSSARGDGTLQKQFRIGKNFRAYEQIIPQEKLDAMRASPEVSSDQFFRTLEPLC